VAVLAGVLWPMCEQIATDLLARTPYVTAVLG
jgi:hypothetical protein